MHLQDDAIGRSITGLNFTDHPPGGLGELADFLSGSEDHLRISAGELVFAPGDEVIQIYIHRSGQVVLFSDSGPCSGSDASPTEPGRVYGIMEAISCERFEFGMSAVTDSEFDLIKAVDLIHFLQTDPTASFRLAQNLGRMYQQILRSIRSH